MAFDHFLVLPHRLERRYLPPEGRVLSAEKEATLFRAKRGIVYRVHVYSLNKKGICHAMTRGLPSKNWERIHCFLLSWNAYACLSKILNTAARATTSRIAKIPATMFRKNSVKNAPIAGTFWNALPDSWRAIADKMKFSGYPSSSPL